MTSPIPTRRRTAVAASLLAALVAALVAGAPPTAAAGGTPVLHTPVPPPGDVVPAGPAALSVLVDADADLAGVTLTVDGRDVAVTTADADPDRRVSGRAELTPGEHRVAVTVEDADGDRASRSWSVVATETSTRRLSGPTRVHTAAAVSEATFPADGSAPAAVLARADDYADALAGVPLAAALDGPLLLTDPATLSAPVADELRRALAEDATVVLLGGNRALTSQVADDVRSLGYRVRRLSGEHRYATAAAIARELPDGDRAIVTSGVSFADALAASAPAARDGVPILLTTPDRLAEATADVLAEREVAAVSLVGGRAAVSPAVHDELDAQVDTVERIAGEDRFATAAAVLERYYDAPTSISLASGVAFPDALAGTRHAAAYGQPVLLAAPDLLPEATADAVGAHRPGHLDVYGGPSAVGPAVVDAAVRAVVDGPDVPRVTAITPAAGATVPYLDAIEITLDREIDPAASTVHVQIGDRELRGTLAPSGPTTTVRFRPLDGAPAPARDVLHDARVTMDLRTPTGRRAHAVSAFRYLAPDPWYATSEGLSLHLPSRDVELIGFHESNHDGARQQFARDTATPSLVLPSRSRDTGDRGAADIVANPDERLVAPVTGRVVRAGGYTLYCYYSDQYLVIEPDGRPGWEVKLLHFQGLSVSAGDRVVAGQTVVGSGPRKLPFESQVDDYSAPRDWPHVHVEVVDTSIPDRPSSGGGC